MLVKSATKIARKFVKVTSLRADDYEAGVRSPRRNWEAETLAAKSRYEEGIKESLKNDSYSKGVRRCGTARQMEKTIAKGVPVFGDRILLAENDMRVAMEPVVAVLEALTLPMKYAKGDKRNIERVSTVTEALHKYKLAKA